MKFYNGKSNHIFIGIMIGDALKEKWTSHEDMIIFQKKVYNCSLSKITYTKFYNIYIYIYIDFPPKKEKKSYKSS